jgi:hypothetical protein
MRIRTRPSSASMSLEASAPTKDRPAASRESISFDLLPQDEPDHLDLDTGEVFQDYGFARLRKNEQKLIDASATIHSSSDASEYQHNAMHYFGKHKTDDSYESPSIHFDVFIEPATFRQLADNMKSGLFPETITFELVDERRFFTIKGEPKQKVPIEYGWEPDGSGLIWHNKEKENQRIRVESVAFGYAIAKSRHEENQIDRLLPMPFTSATEQASAQMALIQAGLIEISRYLRWAAGGITILAIVAVLLIARGLSS